MMHQLASSFLHLDSLKDGHCFFSIMRKQKFDCITSTLWHDLRWLPERQHTGYRV